MSVRGDGYTNHCPACLHSKHVDVHPGDRAEICGGILRPVGFDLGGQKLSVIFRCRSCGAVRRNRTSPADDAEEIQRLMRQFAERGPG